MAQSFEPQPAFDSALTANSITYTVIRPVVERLVTLKPGGTEVVPHLATSCALRRYKADKLSRPAEEPGFRVVRKLHLVDTGPFELEVLAPYPSAPFLALPCGRPPRLSALTAGRPAP